jgi:hypothetical protein
MVNGIMQEFTRPLGCAILLRKNGPGFQLRLIELLSYMGLVALTTIYIDYTGSRQRNPQPQEKHFASEHI